MDRSHVRAEVGSPFPAPTPPHVLRLVGELTLLTLGLVGGYYLTPTILFGPISAVTILFPNAQASQPIRGRMWLVVAATVATTVLFMVLVIAVFPHYENPAVQRFLQSPQFLVPCWLLACGASVWMWRRERRTPPESPSPTEV